MDCTSLSTGDCFHNSTMNNLFFRRAYPAYNYRIPLIRRVRGAVDLGDYSLGLVPTPESVEWFMSLDGSQSIDQLRSLGAKHLGLSRRQITSLLVDGFASGALIDARCKPRTQRWLNEGCRNRMDTDLSCVQKHIVDYSDNFFIKDAAEVIDLRSATQIEVVGDGPLARAIQHIGFDSGFQFTTQRTLACVVIFVSTTHPKVFEHENSHRCSLPHLHVGARLDKAEIGPMVIPGKSSCFRCAQLHRIDASPDWMDVDLQWRHHAKSGQSDSILTYQTAAHTLLLLRHWIDGAEITNTSWTADLPWLNFQARSAPPHPLCGCQLHASNFTA